MSNDLMIKYKDLYSRFISHFVDLHNYHQAFINNPTSTNGVFARKSMTGMIEIEKEMRKMSASVTREHRKNVKDGIKAEKKEKARIKSLPKRRGRPPTKGKTNVINTTN
jgi:hypothetical protein